METMKTFGKTILLLITAGLLAVSCSKGDGPGGGGDVPEFKREPAEIKYYDSYFRKDGVTIRYYKNAKLESSEKPITEKFLLFQAQDGPLQELTVTSQKDTIINGVNYHLYAYDIRGMKENTPYTFSYRYRWQKSDTESIPVADTWHDSRTCLGTLPAIYVAPDGSPDADGLTWETAVDRIQTAYKILTNIAKEANPYMCTPGEWKGGYGGADVDADSLMNRYQWDIRVKEGLYMAGETEKEQYNYQLNVKYTGGYAGNETDADPRGTGKTVIDGGGTMTLYRGNGHFSNFIFQNGCGSSTQAGRYYSHSPIIIYLAEFDNCEFRDNINPAKSVWPGQHGDGGAIFIMNRGQGEGFKVTNDKLDENYPASIFRNCIFDNNECKGWGGSGGAVAMMEFNRVQFYDCTFSGNKASIGMGGAIETLMNNQVELYGCLFENNTSVDGCAIINEYFKVISQNTTFRGNECRWSEDNTPNTVSGVIEVARPSDWVDLGGNVFENNIGQLIKYRPID